MKTFYIYLLGFLLTMSIIVSHQAYSQSSSFGGSLTDIPYCIDKTNDLGYIVAGQSNSIDGEVHGNKGLEDYWIVKLDDNLDTLWTKTYGGSGSDIGRSVMQTTDGGYIIAGYSTSNNFDVSGNHGGMDFWIVKLNNSGNREWSKSLGGSYNELATSIIQDSGGNYVISGSSKSIDGDVTVNHGAFDFWIVKININGDIIWQKSLGGTADDFPHSVQQTPDGGYIVSGHTYSSDGDILGFKGVTDYWVVKLDANGNLTWAKTYGGTEKEFEPKTLPTLDGGYIVAGSTKSNDGDVTGHHGNYDYWVLKLNSDGDIIWTKALGGSADDIAHAVYLTGDGYIIAGETQSNDGDVYGNHGGKDYWVVKLNLNGDKIWSKTFGGSLNDIATSAVVNSYSEFILAGSSNSVDGDVSGNHGLEDFWLINYNSPPTATLNLKVFLEGAFETSEMRTDLNTILPFTQPYNIAPWNYNGIESVINIPNSNIVDWVLVDLLAPAQQSQTYYLIGRKAAFLLKDGTIKDLNGTDNISFPTFSSTDYYVRIHHRNHLSVMSANLLTENDGNYSYDFTTGSNRVIGDIHAQKELSAGVWGMIAADGNASGEVDNRDKNDVWIPEYGQIGYLKGDFDLNSQVDMDDKTTKWATNAGKGITNLQYSVSPNIPPLPPAYPIPADGSINIGINTTLSWLCNDPEGDVVTYNIYFGSSINPPIIAFNFTGTTYSLPLLEPLTNYNWKIVAKDIQGDSTISMIWSFTTLANLIAVTTTPVSNITQTTATSGGNVTSDGGDAVTSRGVCWSTFPSPTTSDSHTTDGNGTGVFVSNLAGLTANTLFYVRAYATNSAGTAYGNEMTFTSLINPLTIEGCQNWYDFTDSSMFTMDGSNLISAIIDQGYDGNDGAATGTLRPLYVANVINGLGVARFYTGSVLKTLTSTETNYETEFTFFCVIYTQDTEGSMMGSNAGYSLLNHTNSFGFRTGNGNYNVNCYTHHRGATCYGNDELYTAYTFRNNSGTKSWWDRKNLRPYNESTLSDLILKDISGIAGYPFTKDIAEIIIYDRALTNTEVDAVQDYLCTKYAFESFTTNNLNRITFTGNSFTAIWVYPQMVLDYLNPSEPGNWIPTRWAGGGMTTEQILPTTSYAFLLNQKTQVPVTGEDIVICWEGTNDIVSGKHSVEVEGHIHTWCDYYKDAGFDVIVLTLLPRDWEDFDTIRDNTNTFIRANYTSYANYLCDVALDDEMGDNGDEEDDTYYIGDHTHPNTVGYRHLVDNWIMPAIQAVIDAD